MATLTLTEQQLLALRAIWEIASPHDNAEDIADALNISNEDRGIDDDGDYKAEDGEDNDPVMKVIGELQIMIMQD